MDSLSPQSPATGDAQQKGSTTSLGEEQQPTEATPEVDEILISHDGELVHSAQEVIATVQHGRTNEPIVQSRQVAPPVNRSSEVPLASIAQANPVQPQSVPQATVAVTAAVSGEPVNKAQNNPATQPIAAEPVAVAAQAQPHIPAAPAVHSGSQVPLPAVSKHDTDHSPLHQQSTEGKSQALDALEAIAAPNPVAAPAPQPSPLTVVPAPSVQQDAGPESGSTIPASEPTAPQPADTSKGDQPLSAARSALRKIIKPITSAKSEPVHLPPEQAFDPYPASEPISLSEEAPDAKKPEQIVTIYSQSTQEAWHALRPNLWLRYLTMATAVFLVALVVYVWMVNGRPTQVDELPFVNNLLQL